MKKTTSTVIICAALIMGIGLVGCEPKGPSGKLTTAPDFDLEKLSGGRAKLSDYKGKIIILNFWATWCPPCRMEIPGFVELQKKYGDKGVAILGISLDQNPKKILPAFAKKYNINYPILLTDGKVAKDYGISPIPTTFIVDQEGKIYQLHIGYRPKNVFEKDIETLLRKK